MDTATRGRVNNLLTKTIEYNIISDSKIKQKDWKNAAEPLAQICYYAVLALFERDQIKPIDKMDTKTKFSEHYIETGIFDKPTGDFYNSIIDIFQDIANHETKKFNKSYVLDLDLKMRSFNWKIVKYIVGYDFMD